MQVTLEVNGSHLDLEVRQLLETLTIEQKSQMAAQLLQKSLDNCNSELMRKVAIDSIIAEYNEGKEDYHKIAYRDGQWVEFRDQRSTVTYSKRDELDKSFKDRTRMSDYFRKDIMGSMLELAKQQVKQTVNEDPVIRLAIYQVIEEIKKDFPKIVHDAMVVYFCSQMQSMSANLATALFHTDTNTRLLADLQTAMQAKGVY